jgi:hypothetical protein
MKLILESHHFLPLRSKYSHQHPILKHNLCSYLGVEDKVTQLYKTGGKIMILYTFILKFLHRRKNIKRKVASITWV